MGVAEDELRDGDRAPRTDVRASGVRDEHRAHCRLLGRGARGGGVSPKGRVQPWKGDVARAEVDLGMPSIQVVPTDDCLHPVAALRHVEVHAYGRLVGEAYP